MTCHVHLVKIDFIPKRLDPCRFSRRVETGDRGCIDNIGSSGRNEGLE